MGKILSYSDCLHLTSPDRKHYLIGGDERQVFREVYGRDATQGELDNLVQNTRIIRSDGSSKAWTDSTAAEAKQYLMSTPEMIEKRYKDAIAPAIDSLQAGIPETAARFKSAREQADAERTPIRERYARLIESIRGQGAGEQQSVTKSLAREYGRRGVPLSSTAFSEEENARVSPIAKYYLSQEAEATASEDSSIRQLDNLLANLAGEETEATRAIRNAIASMQASTGTHAIDSSNAIVKETLDRALQRAQLDLQEKQLSVNEKLQMLGQNLDQRKFDEAVRQFDEEFALKKKTSGGSGSGSGSNINSATKTYLEQLQEILGYVPAGTEKNAVFKYNQALERSGRSDIEMPLFWAIYNGL